MIVYVFGQNKRDAAADGHPARLARDGFLDGFGCFRFGSEFDHQLAAAKSDAFLVERIKGLLAFLAHIDQPGLAQQSQVMGYGRLGDTQLLNDLIDRKPLATDQVHDFLASFVSQRFGKENRIIECHIDNLLFDII
jgi:hypothetical protein